MAQSSLIPELERAIKSHDAQRRTAALSSVADLFRNAKIRDENDERLALFDDVFAQLVKDMTTSTLAKLSGDLSVAKIAPVKLIQQLAQNDSIEVAQPILAHSDQVSEETLIQIAKTKGQDHLQAVASRPHVNEAVSDLLIERGSETVIQAVTANATARISERSFGALTERFAGHEKIAVNIANRQDVPPRVMRALLMKATDTVRTLIINSAPPETRQAVSDLLKESLKAEDFVKSVTRVTEEARKAIYEVKANGRLKEEVLQDLARKRMFGETVVALAVLAAMPVDLVESQMLAEQRDTIIVMCRSIDLRWSTVAAILCLRDVPPTPEQLEAAKTDYSILSAESALRTMRFFYAKQSILQR
jgi:uncharacterized protein (DUF2336 family)